MLGADHKLRIKVGAKVHNFKLSNFTGEDARAFRDMFGFGLVTAFTAPDLDTIAALVWLVRRKANRNLQYGAVARGLNYANTTIEEIGEDSTDGPSNGQAPDEDTDDPSS